MNAEKPRISDRVADVLAALFVVFILLFAAQGPLQELTKTVIPALTPEWEELSKRAKRVALKEGLIGGTFQFLKVNFFSKTAVFSDRCVDLAQPRRSGVGAGSLGFGRRVAASVRGLVSSGLHTGFVPSG